MVSVTTRLLSLYVDRANQRWIVLDNAGNLWSLPAGENSWDHRQPYYPTDDIDLELVPGHYQYLLGLPLRGEVDTHER
jgi:hypothetical protein